MILTLDHPAGERNANQFRERLRWPRRVGEGVYVASSIHLIRVDPFLAAARDLHPLRLRALARADVARVPGIILIPGRHMTEKKHIIWL